VAAVVSIAGGSGLVDVLMVGDREGWWKSMGVCCYDLHALWEMFEQVRCFLSKL
jgi:hypothetical protein